MKKIKSSVTKEFRFEMAHRLRANNGSFYAKEKCGSLHGHSITVRITLVLNAGKPFDQYGFVMDYADFKPLKDWIDRHLDHATLVSENDIELVEFLRLQGDRHFVISGNSASSEQIALLLYEKSRELFESSRLSVTRVSLSETCTSEATVTAD